MQGEGLFWWGVLAVWWLGVVYVGFDIIRDQRSRGRKAQEIHWPILMFVAAVWPFIVGSEIVRQVRGRGK